MGEVIQTTGFFKSQVARGQAKLDLKLRQRPGNNADPVITTDGATGKDTIVVPTVVTKPTP